MQYATFDQKDNTCENGLTVWIPHPEDAKPQICVYIPGEDNPYLVLTPTVVGDTSPDWQNLYDQLGIKGFRELDRSILTSTEVLMLIAAMQAVAVYEA